MNTSVLVERIIAVFETSTLLGAAWDCISDEGKERLKKKFETALTKEPDHEHPETN